ncbi:MDR family MFS transporter [Streptomyces avidinii]|uniref:EmrB/QacA subfamily drug resistance transporter n=1 Tax=Streptomyces avidinii TaxID=1895 RepID=A0ABS4LHD7_STRAV|nr:MDR family MFS transporter [Streptomyces avidinii]MBP2041517.1 EmrB/QacA subfamily drug resistance transporter [Streptomyces avidinii]GGZ34417.1 MFS transporter [Streptomyces avidinii]
MSAATTAEKEPIGHLLTPVWGFILAMTVSALDATIAGTVTPTIVAEFGHVELSAWVFGSYMLALTALLPLYGKFSDHFGRKRMINIGIAIFLVGSLWCGFARSMPELVAARGLQGLGAAALFPIGMAAIGLQFPPRLRSRLQGVFASVFGLSSLLGPLVGSGIGEYVGWRWAFFINPPLLLLAAWLIHRNYREHQTEASGQKVDILGAVLVTYAIAGVLYALYEAGEKRDLGEWSVWAALLTGIAAFVFFIRVERRHESPIIPLTLFSNSALSAAFVVNFVIGLVMYSAIFFVPVFAQGVTGGSIGKTGLTLFPFQVASIVGSLVAGRAIFKVGIRVMGMLSMLLLAVGFGTLMTMDTHTSAWVTASYTLLIGAGTGVGLPVLMIAVQSALPPHLMGIGSSITQLAREFGGMIGVSMLGVLQYYLFVNETEQLKGQAAELVHQAGPRGVSEMLFSQQSAFPADVVELLRSGLSSALTTVFMVTAIICVLGILVSTRMAKEMRRPGPPPGMKPPGMPPAGLSSPEGGPAPAGHQ